MNTGTAASELTQLLQQGQQLQAHAPDWQKTLREQGAAAVAGQPLPGRHEENWRYTPLRFLQDSAYRLFTEDSFEALQPEDIDGLLIDGLEGDRLVFVNGRLAPALCRLGADSHDITVAALGGGLGEVPATLREQLGRVADQQHVLAALNSALMTDGALVHVPAGVRLARPLEILHVSVGLDEPLACHPRHLVVLGEDAHAQVIERYCTLGDSTYFNNVGVEVALGSGSELLHARLQEESRNAQHLTDLQVRLDTRSRYRLVQPSLGGAWSRCDVRVTFAGEQAEAELDGLLLARDRQLNDVHLDIRHEVPGCTSRERFKGVLDGKGRVVFDGRILVAQDAQQTDAQLSNDNLMLSRAAEVDTKPQLEIFADDVKCSHGTTVGEIDSTMLFYLQSRGIPRARAVQMLCQGFAQEVLDHLPGEPLQQHVARILTQRLAETSQAADLQA
jgi:Fe-S cluster assembly protein SufD